MPVSATQGAAVTVCMLSLLCCVHAVCCPVAFTDLTVLGQVQAPLHDTPAQQSFTAFRACR